MSNPPNHRPSSVLPAESTLERFKVNHEVVASLPPNLRDQLLQYVHNWGTPQEALALLDILREVHGSLLFLLDYQATANYRLGDYQQVLTIIERRQRRSANLASQIMELQTLLAMAHDEHAMAVAEDISQAYPLNVAAICAAARAYAQLRQEEKARRLLENYLASRPADPRITLMLAYIAHASGQLQLTDAYLQRLGTGAPPDLNQEELQTFASLLGTLGHQESVRAVYTELERRQLAEFEALQQGLAPLTNAEISPGAKANLAGYASSGPEAIQVSREETRSIELNTLRHFGFSRLRPGQAETIATVQRGESILTVMPTGAGKSLCYQLPALTLPRMTLVISPLIALMKDQVESLPAAAQAKATFINSTLSDDELTQRMERVSRGEYKLIYAAPERLRQREFLRALRQGGIDLFVIDEAHCVSLWGHDFRPDYLFVQEARQELGAPATLAMTATAPPRIRDEILNYIGEPLGLSTSELKAASNGEARIAKQRPRVMSMDIFRNNLHLSAVYIHNEEEKQAALLKFVAETPGSGIVYVNSRHKSENLAYQLRAAGVSAEAYHAGLEQRGAVQDRFMGGKTRVVVATIAFGMGIDKADIRFIVHFHPSRSLAAYYQEVGRAGRDGKPSQGVLFYSSNDWANLRRWAKSEEYSIELLEKTYIAIATQLGVTSQPEVTEKSPADPTTTDHATRRPDDHATPRPDDHATPRPDDHATLKVIFTPRTESVVGPVDARRLQQVLNMDETAVRVSVSILERADLLSRSFDFPQDINISLPRQLPEGARQDKEFAHLLRGLAMRPGQTAGFKTRDVAGFMHWSLADAEAILLDWQAAGYLKVKGSHRVMLVELPPVPADMRARLAYLLEHSAAIAQRRIDDMIGYATVETCRHGYISAHFGSPPRNRCPVCDNCTGIRPDIPERPPTLHLSPDDADIEPMIIDCLISLPKPVGRSGLARILTGSMRAPVTADKARHFGRLNALGETTVTGYLDDLLEDGRLRQYERQGYAVLAPTLRGRGQAELWLAEHPEMAALAAPPEAPAESATSENADEPSEGDKYTGLQKALWLWRRRFAEQLGQPPYVIMSNELMLRVAEHRPQTEEELAALPGMGAQRLQHYGPTILDLVKLHPAQEGDQGLLKTQRETLTQTTAEVKRQIQEKLPTVSAAVEKRIFLKLQELRQKKAITERSKPYLVAGNNLLKEIAQKAPTTKEELEGLLGFRSSGFKDEGEKILAIIQEARAKG